jgi:hypothetical protein
VWTLVGTCEDLLGESTKISLLEGYEIVCRHTSEDDFITSTLCMMRGSTRREGGTFSSVATSFRRLIVTVEGRELKDINVVTGEGRVGRPLHRSCLCQSNCRERTCCGFTRLVLVPIGGFISGCCLRVGLEGEENEDFFLSVTSVPSLDRISVERAR